MRNEGSVSKPCPSRKASLQCRHVSFSGPTILNTVDGAKQNWGWGVNENFLNISEMRTRLLSSGASGNANCEINEFISHIPPSTEKEKAVYKVPSGKPSSWPLEEIKATLPMYSAT